MSLMLKKKGGKVFAPKIAARRPGAPSAPSSARPSVEPPSQTPASTLETIPVPDQGETHDLTREPSLRIVEPTPQQPVLETPNVPIPPKVQPTLDTAQGSSINSQNSAVPPDKGSLKRKTRDDDNDEETEIPHKRYQPTGLKTPSSSISRATAVLPLTNNLTRETRDEPAAIEARSKPHQPSSLDATRSPPQSAPTIQPQVVQRDIPEISRPESELIEHPQPPNSVPSARDEVLTDGSLSIEAVEYVESSQPSSSVPDAISDDSNQLPTPEDTQDDSPYEYPDPELSATSFGGTPGLGAAGDVGSSGAQVPRIVPMAPLNPDGTPGEAIQQPAAGTTNKKIMKRQKIQAAEENGDVRATVEMQLNKPRRAPSKKQSRKKKDGDKKKDKRAMTPEGASDEEIDKDAMTMADLCKDLRIGKKFSKHDEIKRREMQKKMKARLARTNPDLASLVEVDEEGREAGSTPPEGEEPETTQSTFVAGPVMRVVDGQIVLDEQSMNLDRQKRAAAERAEMEEVEENEFSHITTSGTYMKRERTQFWDMAATEIFYKGLRMFGTDFEMIAKMFPNRNRRQIKLKFNKEERDNPAMLNRILMGAGTSIDMDEYEELTGLKFEEVADIEAERKRIEAEQNAEEAKHAAEQAEITRKKKEAIHARSGGRALESGDNEPASGNWEASAAPRSGKGASKKKQKKNIHTGRMDNDDFEVVGEI